MSATSWVEEELAGLDCKIMMQTSVDEPFIKKFKPDAIVLATGAYTPNELNVQDDGSIQILPTDDAAAGTFEDTKFELDGTKSLMIDLRGNYETALVLESLGRRGSQVTIRHILSTVDYPGKDQAMVNANPDIVFEFDPVHIESGAIAP